jgi:hypothetical protein
MSNVGISIEKPNSDEGEKRTFTDFKVVSESWDLYKIDDGSVLRARPLLSGVMLDGIIEDIETQLKEQKEPKLGMTFRAKQMFEVEPPVELRGNPDRKKYSNQELRECISSPDMNFETTKQSWNIYELKNGLKIKLRLSVTAIAKTSKFDERGLPIYLIDFNMEIKSELPEPIKKILAEKKAKTPVESPTFKPIE